MPVNGQRCLSCEWRNDREGFFVHADCPTPVETREVSWLGCFYECGRKNKRLEGEFCEHKECTNCREISVGPENSGFYICCTCFELH